MAVKTILHPTDFSKSATQALKQAVRLGLTHGARLHVFHAILLHTEDTAQVELSMTEYLRTARGHAAEWAQGTGLEGRDLEIKTTVERGVFAFEGVMDRAAELLPDVIVTGTHGRTGLAKFLIGSEAEKMLRHAPCDVMTIRNDASLGGEAGGFAHVLVGVDFSEDSKRAIAAARAYAAPDGGHITVLHAVEPLPPMYYAGSVADRFQLDPDLPKRIEERLRELAGNGGVNTRVTEGVPGAELMRVADEVGADLIVVGSRGLTGWEHLLVGSVTERVVRFAKRAVLTVR